MGNSLSLCIITISWTILDLHIHHRQSRLSNCGHSGVLIGCLFPIKQAAGDELVANVDWCLQYPIVLCVLPP